MVLCVCLDFRELTPIEEASRMNQKLKANYEARLARLTPGQAYQKTSLVSKCVPALSGQWSDQGLIYEGIDHETKTRFRHCDLMITMIMIFVWGALLSTDPLGPILIERVRLSQQIVTQHISITWMPCKVCDNVGLPRDKPWNTVLWCTPKCPCAAAWYTKQALHSILQRRVACMHILHCKRVTPLFSRLEPVWQCENQPTFYIDSCLSSVI